MATAREKWTALKEKISQASALTSITNRAMILTGLALADDFIVELLNEIDEAKRGDHGGR